MNKHGFGLAYREGWFLKCPLPLTGGRRSGKEHNENLTPSLSVFRLPRADFSCRYGFDPERYH